jgi:hypothetical protein
MTADSCNPAVPSRRAKYSDELRGQTLFGAQPKSRNFCLAADAKYFSPDRPTSLIFQLVERGGSQSPPPVTTSHQILDFYVQHSNEIC